MLEPGTFHKNLSLRSPPDDLSSSSLPLVNISASVSLSGADMTMYLKKMSRGEAVEGGGGGGGGG